MAAAPHRFTRIRLRADWSRRAARLGERFLPRLEHFSLLGLVIILLSLLMMLPVPGTNTLPALVPLTLSIGLIESDGLLTLLAALAALGLAVLYTEAVYLLVIWLAG
jgi:hypothetical protein